MKRVIKKRENIKRRSQVNKKATLIVVFVMYLFSSILLKNYNTDLNHQLQKIESENTQIISLNQTLKIKVDELKSFERMSNVAEKNGLQSREGTIKNVK